MKNVFFVTIYRIGSTASKVVELKFESEEAMNNYIMATFMVDINNAIIKFDTRTQNDYCESEIWFFESKGFSWRINITIK